MSKTRIAITTLFIAVLAALGISMPAMAATVNEGATTPVPFTHTMHANPATDLSGITYTIGIAGTAADGTTGSYASTAVAVIGSPFTEGAITPATSSPAVRSDSTESTKIWADTETLAALFGSDDPTNTDADSGYPKFASNFPQAGIYKFTISETRSGADDTKWAYTPESNGAYTLTVWIENNSDDITKRHYDGWVLTDPSGTKVDVNTTAGTEAGADFTSTYTATTSLNVTKQVAGEYASTTYAFPQEITLTLPDWAADADNITAIGGQSGQWTASSGANRTYTVSLAHGETVTFSNLPVGTRYGIHETSQTDAAGLSYDAGIAWNVDDGGTSGATVQPKNATLRDDGSFKTPTAAFTLSASSLKTTDDGITIEPGDEVTVNVTPDEGQKLDDVVVIGTKTGDDIDTDVDIDANTAEFTMPDEGIEIDVQTSEKFVYNAETMNWSTGTLEGISAALAAHYDDDIDFDIHSVWNVGAQRTVTLNGMDSGDVLIELDTNVFKFVPTDLPDGELVTYVLVDDNPSYTVKVGEEVKQAAFVIQQKDCLSVSGRMNTTETNTTGWKNSTLRNWLNTTYKNNVSSDISAVVKEAQNVKTANQGEGATKTDVTQDFWFLPTEGEVFGKQTYSWPSYEPLGAGEMHQWYYYKNEILRAKKKGSAGNECGWRERSPYYNHSTAFSDVSSDRKAGSSWAASGDGIAPCGCI